MFLVIDLGNTNHKAGLFSSGKLIWTGSWKTLTPTRLNRIFHKNPGITHSIISSVIQYPTSNIQHLYDKTSCLELTESTPVPITNKYRSPSTLGKDRLASAVAASLLFPGTDCLVINAGTCITYDFINREKEYLGGAISPGMQMRFKALHTFTSKLPLVSVLTDPPLTGTDTDSSIVSGVVNGMAGEIDSIAKQYLGLFPELKIILSGGDANYLVNRLKIGIFALPNIVLYGLNEILRFNFNVEERS